MIQGHQCQGCDFGNAGLETGKLPEGGPAGSLCAQAPQGCGVTLHLTGSDWPLRLPFPPRRITAALFFSQFVLLVCLETPKQGKHPKMR